MRYRSPRAATIVTASPSSSSIKVRTPAGRSSTGGATRVSSTTASLMAPLEATELFGAPPPYAAACVWELPILMFERNAWVATVMSDMPGGGIDAYLAERLVGAI